MRDRQRESIADKAADRLQLAGHHRDDLAGRGPIEMLKRKSQDPLVKLVPQTAQHALADLSFLGIEMQLEPAVNQYESEEYAAQHQEVGDLIEIPSHELLREILAGNGTIDDQFRQIQGIVEERKRNQRDDHQINLITQAVMQDVAIDRGIEPIPLVLRQQAAHR